MRNHALRRPAQPTPTRAVLPGRSLNFDGNRARFVPRDRSVAPRSETVLRPVLRIRTTSRSAPPRPNTDTIFSPASGEAARALAGDTPAHPFARQRAISRCTSSWKSVRYPKSGFWPAIRSAFSSSVRLKRHGVTWRSGSQSR